ncbi:MAG TPA: ABC transporter ATP-binding protein [Candidatus Limnocylindria bacterium]|nr:ABC transporter ATP-binding protein [Candidatus Limnocylindria bacterium]
MSLLEVSNIDAFYGNIHALRAVSLTVEDGEIVTLIGANGAGKSTTLNCISGLVRPRGGTITFDGTDLAHVAAHKIVERGVIQVPEGRRVFARLSVEENLKMGGFSLTDKATIRDGIDRAFEMFPRLKERRGQTAGTLSGGEQQMLAMGRALMAKPRILLLDEPSMGLAPTLVESIFATIEKIHADGTSILLVEQNAQMALNVASRGYVLQSGQIMLADTAANLAANAQVREAYLGVA